MSPPSNHSLFSIWIRALYSGVVSLFLNFAWFSKISSKTGSLTCTCFYSPIYWSLPCPVTGLLNSLFDASIFLDFQLAPNLKFTISGIHPAVNTSFSLLGALTMSSCLPFTICLDYHDRDYHTPYRHGTFSPDGTSPISSWNGSRSSPDSAWGSALITDYTYTLTYLLWSAMTRASLHRTLRGFLTEYLHFFSSMPMMHFSIFFRPIVSCSDLDEHLIFSTAI